MNENEKLFFPNNDIPPSENIANDNKVQGNNDRKFKLGKAIEKFGNNVDTGSDLLDDTLSSVGDLARGTLESFKDTLQSKDKRNINPKNFSSKEVSISNRHRDPISGILNDTFNGNLFDAGLNSVNLFNFGSKWRMVTDQYSDKELYPFKYWYQLDPTNKNNDIVGDLEANEQELEKPDSLIKVLESIEDPTSLGYTLKIDIKKSPLFNDKITSFIEKYKPEHSELNLASEYLFTFREEMKKILTSLENKKRDSDVAGVINTNQDDSKSYNSQYNKNHYVAKIEGLDKLDNPFVGHDDSDQDKSGIKSIGESLTITLNEDVRLFVTRMVMSYRNMSYSYNQGKKLIPENLLRFNMYIKINDFRNFTRNGLDNAMGNNIKNKYSRVIYELKDCEFYFDSSINPSTITMGGMGSVTTEYSSLKMKIKYRKVNRIFYSSLFDRNYKDFIISDKFYRPDTNISQNFLIDTGFDGRLFAINDTNNNQDENSSKRITTSNNIPINQSLGERVSRLRNRGLLNEDDNDSAISRFAKGIGNNAIRSGFEVVDEGLQNARNTINESEEGLKSVPNKVKDFLRRPNTIKDFLINKVSSKIDGQTNVYKEEDASKDRGEATNSGGGSNTKSSARYGYVPDIPKEATVYTINDEGSATGSGGDGVTSSESYNFKIQSPDMNLQPVDDSGEVHNVSGIKSSANYNYTPDEPVLKRVNDINDIGTETGNGGDGIDSSGDYINNIQDPNEDVHPNVNQDIIEPTNDLHPEIDQDVIEPTNDLHPEIDQDVIEPTNDLHPDINQDITDPTQDLHPDINLDIIEPINDLHPDINQDVIEPTNNLHPEIDQNVIEPTNDLHPEVNQDITDPTQDLHPDINLDIIEPINDLHPDVNQDIIEPINDLHPDINQDIIEPTNDLHPDINQDIIEPTQDLHPKNNTLINDPKSENKQKSFRDFIRKDPPNNDALDDNSLSGSEC